MSVDMICESASLCYRLRVMTTSNDISRAVGILQRGGLVAFPTETVYGLGADATQDRAVAKVYAAKGRPQFNPLIAHVADTEAAMALGFFDPLSEKIARAFWPGPITLVVPRAKACAVSLLASAGLETIAVRVPAHPVALELLRAFGKPVVAPSANPSGRISPTSAQHVKDHMSVDMVLDGGECVVGLESTVIRVMEDGPYLLRAGGVAREAIEDVIARKVMNPTRFDGDLHSPGQLESHYAPRATLRLDAAAPDAGEIYLGFGEYAFGQHTLSAEGDIVEAAANLFRKLHELDQLTPDTIAVAPIPIKGIGEAINDRLKRAAAPRPS
jgi:L-threonylcarbamoyladenylate synthase